MESQPGQRYLFQKPTALLVVAFGLFVLAAFLTAATGGEANVFVNFFYLPIILVAFAAGWVWALVVALAASTWMLFLDPFARLFSESFLVRLGVMGIVAVVSGRLFESLQAEEKAKEEWRLSTQRRIREIISLRTLDQFILADTDIHNQLPAIIRLVAETLSADLALVLYDGAGGFRLAASYGVPAEWLPKLEGFAAKENDSFWAKPYLVTVRNLKEANHIGWPAFSTLCKELSLSWGCIVPLLVGKHHFGSLALFYANQKVQDEEVGREAEIFAGQIAIMVRHNQLVEDLKNLTFDLVQALSETIDLRDAYTGGHSKRVADYAVGIGKELNLSGEELRSLRYAAILHDLGKIAVSESILRKPDSLNKAEWEEMRRHPTQAVQVLERVAFFRDILPAICYHHEKYNGQGYPEGLGNGAIPLLARILSLADSFEAMISDRPYRKALSREEALAEIKRQRGEQFDPLVVDAFFRYLNATNTVN